MAKKSTITIRVDEGIKKQSEELFSDLGISLPMAIHVFLRQAIRERGFPFEITLFPQGNASDQEKAETDCD